MNIFLVRHGESQGNVDKNIHATTADHAIPLSDRGKEQAARAGQFLRQYIEETDHRINIKTKHGFHPGLSTRLWTSPYLRTRQTAELIKGSLGDILRDSREHVNLCEQQFGLFDGVPDEELPVRFPLEHAHYKKNEDHEGRFWARMPLGESRFDVAVRVHQAFGTFQRDADKHGIENIIVVCHGVTLRAFVMQWLHYSPEWFENARNPKNTAIYRIAEGEDMGYIYAGE